MGPASDEDLPSLLHKGEPPSAPFPSFKENGPLQVSLSCLGDGHLRQDEGAGWGILFPVPLREDVGWSLRLLGFQVPVQAPSSLYVL